MFLKPVLAAMGWTTGASVPVHWPIQNTQNPYVASCRRWQKKNNHVFCLFLFFVFFSLRPSVSHGHFTKDNFAIGELTRGCSESFAGSKSDTFLMGVGLCQDHPWSVLL